MGSEGVFDRADVREIRKEYGLHELDPLPLRLLPESLFTSTYEIGAGEWQDFIATDIADWPCRQRETDGAASSGHDVALVIRTEEHRSELQSLMRTSYDVCGRKKK